MAMGRGAPRNREPLCRLLIFDAADGVQLSGLLYEPERRSRRAAVFLHGTGGASVFDSPRTNLLAAELVVRGIAFFPFNNRGAHLVTRLRGRRSGFGGMAYELVRECVADIDGAVKRLRAAGYRELFLIGHSTGANKVAIYDSRRKRSPFRKYVLLAGGDDTGLLVARSGRKMITRARARVRARRGSELVPPSIHPLPMSWRAFYDMINPDGDYNVFPFGEVLTGRRLSRRPLFRHVRAIRRPSLYVYGENDEYCYGDVAGCVRILSGYVGANGEIVVMKDAGHGFGGKESELGALIGEWLTAS